ncbi:MAG: 3-deoxy-D-manno-octulosonic acid kinase [Xanthomonadales bacterium]|nr:3-deoxy-D-manno-octulosonic acid kinase [Xanthomonadales bacterium]
MGDGFGMTGEQPIQAEMLTEGARVVIFDAARLPRPHAHWFDPAHWPRRRVLDRGRGATFAIEADFGPAVLRRYRRGGAVARVLKDRYVWTGEAQARPFAEFRLLAAAFAAGLPVPRPLAAQVRRRGAFYSGDLLMAEIARTQTLSARLQVESDWTSFDWDGVGRTLGRVHAAGFRHADLNAHNLLLDDDGGVHVIDWDRGRRCAAGAWAETVLARLQRSLRKLFGERAEAADAREGWRLLLAAHAAGLRA